MESSAFFILSLLIVVWFVFYLVATLLKLQRFGLEVHPVYALYKSTRLNAFLGRLGRWSPRLWRVAGNMGVAASFGEVAFMAYLLLLNLYRFIFVPQQASAVVPLIPGVTIRLESLPWFLAAAGVIILTHELAHGVQCVIEGVAIKSSAILLAVLTFGGAVEPDEESMEAASNISKMRIFAAGSFVNLVTGIILVVVFLFFGGAMPEAVYLFLQWIYFLALNLALVNMLPISPLDGGQMFRTFVESLGLSGTVVPRVATYGFLALLASNIALSLARFGLIPI